jgi:nucleoid-associated protein YgaU
MSLGTKTIIVEADETLSHIALKHMGDASRWNELFEANYATIIETQRRYEAPRKQIGSPHLIYPGMSLVVPFL